MLLDSSAWSRLVETQNGTAGQVSINIESSGASKEELPVVRFVFQPTVRAFTKRVVPPSTNIKATQARHVRGGYSGALGDLAPFFSPTSCWTYTYEPMEVKEGWSRCVYVCMCLCGRVGPWWVPGQLMRVEQE